jgi:hypothetical protein
LCLTPPISFRALSWGEFAGQQNWEATATGNDAPRSAQVLAVARVATRQATMLETEVEIDR